MNLPVPPWLENATPAELLAAAEKLDARSDERKREMFSVDKKADAAASAQYYDLAALLYEEALSLLQESMDLHASAVGLRRIARSS